MQDNGSQTGLVLSLSIGIAIMAACGVMACVFAMLTMVIGL